MAVEEYLKAKFGRIEHTGAGRELNFRCFNCGDKGKHFYYNIEKNAGFCHRCDTKVGSVFGLVMAIEGNHVSAARMMNMYNIIPGTKLKPVETKVPGVLYLPECAELRADSGGIAGRQAYAYLQKRGLSLYDMQLFKLRWTVTGKWAGMILIPVYEKGVLVYYMGRAFLPHKRPEKLFPSKDEVATGKSEVVFNLDEAADTGRIVITEGAFDAMRVGASGVAILGKSLSTIQRDKILAKSPTEIVVMLDSDAARDCLKMAEVLFHHHPNVHVVLLESGDPGSINTITLTAMINSAPKVTIEYIMRERLKRC